MTHEHLGDSRGDAVTDADISQRPAEAVEGHKSALSVNLWDTGLFEMGIQSTVIESGSRDESASPLRSSEIPQSYSCIKCIDQERDGVVTAGLADMALDTQHRALDTEDEIVHRDLFHLTLAEPGKGHQCVHRSDFWIDLGKSAEFVIGKRALLADRLSVAAWRRDRFNESRRNVSTPLHVREEPSKSICIMAVGGCRIPRIERISEPVIKVIDAKVSQRLEPEILNKFWKSLAKLSHVLR